MGNRARTLRSLKKVIDIMAIVILGEQAGMAQDLVDYVNPFVGTSGGGNTFPGAVVPWGMVSVSPHTAPGSPSGYLYGQRAFYGFGHTHLSGTGCADLGSVKIFVARKDASMGGVSRGTPFSHEEASPGYYRLRLDEVKVDAEVTASMHSGMTRLSSALPETLDLYIDAGSSLGLLGGGSVKVVSDGEAQGYNIGGGMCGELNRHRTYFVAMINHAALERGIWEGETKSAGQEVSSEGVSVGGWFRIVVGPDQPLLVKVGISYVSTDNARMNLEREIPDWDFDRVRVQARSCWEEELSHIRVQGGTDQDKVKFYTALYHTLIHPSVSSDVNGDYVPLGGGTPRRYSNKQRYSVYSLWDTYRTVHPLLTLVYPGIQTAMVQTMTDMSRETGWLPKWELGSNETYLMVGDPATIVIADSYVNGLRDFDVRAAVAAIEKASTVLSDGKAPLIRPGYHEYLRFGYIPVDQDTTQEWWVWGPVSTTLEYCLADWATAQMMAELGDSTKALEYHRRSMFYRNMFDATTGFLRPRGSDGSWLTPFDPLRTEGSGSWSGSGGPGYVEGNAWDYTWFVPHDIAGLMSLFGGPEPFAAKLSEGFAAGRFTMSNEPDIGNPYVYRLIPGFEAKTVGIVEGILKSDFGVASDGLPGNDDAGAISAWYVFSALGLYPFCPGSGMYLVGRPVFDRVEITLDSAVYPGRKILIERQRDPNAKRGTETLRLHGKVIEGYEVTHRELVKGGTLTIGVADGD